jgi:peptide-methionine (S)-S-oxide reductase
MAAHIPDYEKKQAELSQRGMISISQTELKKKKEEGTKIVTEIVDAGEWYDAEDYHQLYLIKNPYGYECPAHTLYW